MLLVRDNRYFLLSITLFYLFVDQLLEYHQQSDNLRLINGYLFLIKNLIHLLGTHIDEFLRSSSQIHSSINLTKPLDINEQYLPINLRQIIEVKNNNNKFISFLFFENLYLVYGYGLLSLFTTSRS